MLDPDLCSRTLAVALRSGGDFAEVFAEARSSTSARFDDGRVEDVVSGRRRGAGVRVVRGESTGYAHTADLTERGLHDVAEAAAAAARGTAGAAPVIALEQRPTSRPHAVTIRPESVDKARKVELLERADAAAPACGSCAGSRPGTPTPPT